MINIENFVDVNIKRHQTSVVTSTRDTVVVFVSFTPHNEEVYTYSSLDEVKADQYITQTYFKNAAEIFFRNGGLKLKAIHKASDLDYDSDIATLDDNEIIVLNARAQTVTANLTETQKLAKAQTQKTSLASIHEKLFIAGVNANESITSADNKLSNFILKYCGNVNKAYEFTIAAYLTQIDVYKANSVNDYMFTAETILTSDLATQVVDDNELYETCINNNVNVDIELAGATRNCGGNCMNSSDILEADIVNEYVRIILCQTITSRLVNLLATKVKSSDVIQKMYVVITNELNRYRSSGYYSSDKIWSDTDWIVKGDDGIDYTIVEQGTAIANGYLIKILPMSSRTTEARKTHSAPTVYLVIADQYSIRKITVEGETI